MATNIAVSGNAGQYPYMVPPRGFKPIYRPGGPTIIPVGTLQGTLIQLAVVNVMPRFKGWIRRMGLESGDWDSVGFQIFRGALPDTDGLGLITSPIGSPSTPEDIYMEVSTNLPVTLYAVARVALAANTPVRWYLGGWLYEEAGNV